MPRRGRLFTLLALLLTVALLALAVSCGDDDGEEQSITFMAGFRPQANLPFVAAYVALDQGYFADEGLEGRCDHPHHDRHVAAEPYRNEK